MKAVWIPNLITVLRLLLVPPVVWLLLQRRFDLALLLFLIAGLSDGFDGFLARRYGWKTRLGGWLDPIADKSLQVSVYFTLTWLGLLPVWLLVAVIGRDVVIVAGSLAYYFWIERVEAQPRLLSKLNTVLQILLVVVVLATRASGWMPPAAAMEALVWLVFVVTVASGADYVWVWGRRALRAVRARRRAQTGEGGDGRR